MNIASQMESVNSTLGVGGAISRLKPDYEVRPQQIEMAEAVARAIESRTHLIVEGPTGVGKSFAYLVPALQWAIETKKKVVVSTGTIALQQQILGKDIEFLKSVMPPLLVELIKGRENYVGLRRLFNAEFDDEDLADDLDQLKGMR